MVEQRLLFLFSNDEDARKNFGPYTAGFIKIEYDNLEALEKVLKSKFKYCRIFSGTNSR